MPVMTNAIVTFFFTTITSTHKFRLVIYKRGCYSLRFSFKMKVIG